MLVAMYGQPAFWRDALGRALQPGEQGICYATYLVTDRHGSQPWTLFLTDRRLYWCRMSPSGEFTDESYYAEHSEIDAIGPVINDSRGLFVLAHRVDGERVQFLGRCRSARAGKGIHRLMLRALDLTLGQPPFMRFRRGRDDMLTRIEPRRRRPPSL